MNKMNPEIKAQWITALRSGEYEQGRASLNYENRYCCLGVLCELATKAGVAEKVAKTAVARYDGASAYVPESVQEWAGLNSEEGALRDDVEYSRPSAVPGGGMINGIARSLASLNDSARYDFNQIADVIEEQF